MRARIGLVALVAALALVVAPAAASGEVCDASGRFCIVNPPTAANPWVAPQVVQFRLPAEAHPDYSGGWWKQGERPGGKLAAPVIVAPGPPGGTTLYQGVLQPVVSVDPVPNEFLPLDGTVSVTLTAQVSDDACGCYQETTATFDNLPILATLTGFDWRITRRRTSYRAVMSFTARSPVELKQLFHASGFEQDGSVDFGRLRVKRVTSGVGPQRITQTLGARSVSRFCEAFLRCALFTEAVVGAPFEGGSLLRSVQRPVAAENANPKARCIRARKRVARLMRKLKQATATRQRAKVRSQLRRARAKARRVCRE